MYLCWGGNISSLFCDVFIASFVCMYRILEVVAPIVCVWGGHEY